MMNLIFSTGIVVATLAAGQAQAAMSCTGKTSQGSQLQLTVNDTTADVLVTDAAGTVTLRTTIAGLANVWDGHETGLVTGPGLAVRYADDYGCFRRVSITTDVRGGGVGLIESIDVPGCRGGTTPDNVCFPQGLGR